MNPLPPQAGAEKYVAAMGGAEQVLKLGQQAYDRGDYRWAAELLNHLVFATGEQAAKDLLAQAYTQLAYQAESAPWRNVYLSGAQELTQGKSDNVINLTMMRDILKHAPVDRFFDAMAATVNSEDADGESLSFIIEFSDSGDQYLLWLENSVLHHKLIKDNAELEVNARIRISHPMFLDIVLGDASLMSMVGSNELNIDGSTLDLVKFLSLLDKQKEPFNIVEP